MRDIILRVVDGRMTIITADDQQPVEGRSWENINDAAQFVRALGGVLGGIGRDESGRFRRGLLPVPVVVSQLPETEVVAYPLPNVVIGDCDWFTE